MTAVKVLGIPGSLRRGSYNRRLLDAAAESAPPGLSVSVVPHEVLAAIPPFDGDLEASTGDPEAVRELRARVRDADGLLFSTPEYNQSIPGVLKNHIDWLSRPRPDEVLAGKPVAVMGATTGDWGTRLAQSVTRHVLTATEALVLPAPALYVRNADRLFVAEGLRDPATRGRLERLLSALADWIARARQPGLARSAGNGVLPGA